ncbi:hypothetical protein J7384_17770 [Endozoicomonas sp. G2_1]|uniref:hypothetical protein n=1 Tax=Endozoicomonas sp. G2_1 TaxID=2821091 RepID=UPI001ADAF567|nr:hypothetical protein [Endozoicomonas sp. G2_1]MBO9492214.1 hypothetical protein [Endozoicomonas sp. G2_1]
MNPFRGSLEALDDRQGLDANNPYSFRYRFNRGEDGYASRLNAQIRRDQWQDYQQRFMPIHGELFDATLGRDLVDQQIGRVDDNVEQSFDVAEASVNNRRQRMGLSDLTVDHSADKALAKVHAKNNIRQASQQRKINAITGASNAVATNTGIS